MTPAQILWLVAFLVFLAAEAGTVALVSLWFALGALAALLVSWFGGPFWLQFLLFLTVSCAALAALRPFVRKYLRPRIVPTNTDSLIGMEAILTADVNNFLDEGEVTLRGIPWSARSTSGDPIPAGTTITVDRIEGTRVFVSPVPVSEQV